LGSIDCRRGDYHPKPAIECEADPRSTSRLRGRPFWSQRRRRSATIDPHEALRLAIKAGVAPAGDLDRVRALVGVLESSSKKAPVVDIASRRTQS
jgi:hypothetical protein